MSIFNVQTSGYNIKLLMIYKEIYAVIILGLLFLKYKIKLYKYEKIIFPLLLWVIVSYFFSDINVENKLYYSRQFLILFVSYFLGRYLYLAIKGNDYKIKSFIRLVLLMGFFAVAVGFFFLILNNDLYIWKDWFNIGFIMEAKGTAYTDYPDFRTSLGPYYLYRMFSFFFDAINLSYFILVSICCSFLFKSKYIIFIRLFLFVGLILTFGKGALGILILVSIWLIFLFKFKLNPKLFLFIYLSFIFLAFLFIEGSSFRSSIGVHIAGFISPLINSIHFPLGNGIGSGGVYYAMSHNIRAWNLTDMGAESLIGSLIYQLGYPGLLLYFIFFIGFIKKLLNKAYQGNKINFNYILFSGIIFSVFLISFFQEATLGLNYTGILIIISSFMLEKTHLE
ncbi:hypothetical protein [Heyndrickxia coagulans]|nr:hypothetical protein [Heyndrickxia coagulans]